MQLYAVKLCRHATPHLMRECASDGIGMLSAHSESFVGWVLPPAAFFPPAPARQGFSPLDPSTPQAGAGSSDNATVVEGRKTPGCPPGSGGAMPARSLHFRTGRADEAQSMVLRYHYSRRVPSNVQFVGSLHLDGGLFGGDGPMVAAAFFSIPPTRWAEDVLELSRLVRADERVPLTLLISLCCRELKKGGADLLVSFADRTQGHEGFVYRAANWRYAGCRERSQDGVVIDGAFYPGRSCNSLYGTRSPAKLQAMFPHKSIEPHFDEGKHLYWKALGNKGDSKARRLGLAE